MSSSKNNTIYKKTSFLAGMNSEFINEFYADYISDSKSLPESWRKFFDGLTDEEKTIFDNLKGPSWSPEKKFKKLKVPLDGNKETKEKSSDLNLNSVKISETARKLGVNWYMQNNKIESFYES